MAQFTVCDTCGAILVDNLGKYSSYYSIKAELIRPPWSLTTRKDHSSYVVCADCFEKITECIADLTKINFKGKVPIVHIPLGTIPNEKGEDDENSNS